MKKMILSLFVSLAATFAIAAPSTEVVPYYGEKFYQDLSTGVSNSDLKFNIKSVLRSYHRASSGSYDEILNSCSGPGCYAQTSLGYDGARVYLMGVYYLVDHGNGKYGVRDVYCNNIRSETEFSGEAPGPKKIPDSTVINIEHTWPQSHFSGQHKRDIQKADLHHLFPTDSKANSTRGNYHFGEVVKDTKRVSCSASRFGDSHDRRNVFEPPSNHKGNVARALFYFSLRYDLPIDSSEEATLRKWAHEDPIDEDELRRNNEIYKVQGNRNPFIDFPGLEDSISDF